MKLVVAFIQDYDTDAVLRALTSDGFRVTRISGVGGFLHSANTTLFVGAEDDHVENCLATIRRNSRAREESPVSAHDAAALGLTIGDITPVVVGGAVVLILPISRFEQIRN